MSVRKSKRKAKKRSHEEGLWLVTEEGHWIEVKKKLIKANNLIEEPAIRYGKPFEEGKPIEQIYGVSYPNFRESALDYIKARFAAEEVPLTAKTMFPKSKIADTKFDAFIGGVVMVLEDYPLAPPKTQGGPGSTRRGYVDRQLKQIEEYQKFQVGSVSETGKENLVPFPDLFQTHQIWERTLPAPGFPKGVLMVLPRFPNYEVWLTEKEYELRALDDVGRFALHRYAQKLNNYPFPVTGEDGKPELDGDGEPLIVHQEAMLYMNGYVAQTGSSQQYHAFIVPVLIQAKDGLKFIFELKLSKVPKKYTTLMDVPTEGEVPVTISARQKPLLYATVTEMLAKAMAQE